MSAMTTTPISFQLSKFPTTSRSRVFSSSFSSRPLRAAPILPSLRLSKVPLRRHGFVTVAAASAAGSPSLDGEEDPYKVVGISPDMGFEQMKMAFARKRKDAERQGDEEFMGKLERAYDKIMMMQLHNRKKGAVQVPTDIKYADKLPMIPWEPRRFVSSTKDIYINLGIAAVFIGCTCIYRHADWKPLQYLCFAFFYRIFQKLKFTEPAITPILNEYGEEEGRGLRMGKRLLRSLGLVFGCICVASLGFTALLKLDEHFGQYVRQYIPHYIFSNQELIVTIISSILLCFVASCYR